MVKTRRRAVSTRRRPARPPASHAIEPDPIRVVPLYVPAGARRAPTAQLTYRNGPLISAVDVFTIFWGAGWARAPQAGMIGEINAFFDFVVTSPLIDQLAEYSVPRYPIGHGKRAGTTTITTPRLKTAVTDNAIQAMLRQQIANGKRIPTPSANTLYFVYVHPGVRVVMGGSASCQSFCGYHNAINGTSIFYAVMPYPDCRGCTGNLSAIDALTSTSSHELCEAITDPVPGQGWYDDANGEIGDICAWETKKMGGYAVQLEWSNKAARCE